VRFAISMNTPLPAMVPLRKKTRFVAYSESHAVCLSYNPILLSVSAAAVGMDKLFPIERLQR